MFEKIEWKASYNLNVATIDSQHQQLVVVANELYDLANGDKDAYQRGITAALKKLVDYTDYHLKFEEDFLRSKGYPQIDFHKMQHDQFISQINAQVKKLTDPHQQDGLVLYDYLLKWLLNHIAKSDKAWSLHVLSK